MIRSEPGEKGFFVKFKGEIEFKAKKESGVITEALSAGVQITGGQYKKF